ncbi:glycosyltransferase [Proteus terrae]|uniref:glycosyltransferase n=2 Tax=Proteus terrae TaxID=1574161 RepID=UPI000C16B1C8|nr:glycosyltransferase [Proteus terrae]
MPKFCIAISTMNERINNIFIPEYDKDVNYLLIHQINDKNFYPNKLLNERSDIKYINTDQFGLSKSRNIALNKCNTEYLFVMDDDVSYDIDAMKKIVHFMSIEKVDVGTFYHNYTNNNSTLKNTRKKITLNYINIAKVSSIDICINVNSIKKNAIIFNENFGLGTDLPSGEEIIFLSDCLKKSLNLIRYPLIVSTHPPIASGLDFYSSTNKIRAKKKMIEIIYGRFSFLFKIMFTIKKFKRAYQAGFGFQFVKAMFLE